MRTATLLTCIGPDALDILEGLDFEEESQRNNIDIVMKKLEEYCVGETNEIYERYCFNKQDQEINETVGTLRTLRSFESLQRHAILGLLKTV